MVDLKPRQVKIHNIEVLSFNLPYFKLSYYILTIWCSSLIIEINCGTGTYVRTIVHDIGIALGSRAHCTSLTRTKQGIFNIEQSMNKADWSYDRILYDLRYWNSTIKNMKLK